MSYKHIDAYQPDGYRGCKPCRELDCCCYEKKQKWENCWTPCYEKKKSCCGSHDGWDYGKKDGWDYGKKDGWDNKKYYDYDNKYYSYGKYGKSWEISDTDRRLPGTPAAKLHHTLGHNLARRTGQQYADKKNSTGAYGSYT